MNIDVLMSMGNATISNGLISKGFINLSLEERGTVWLSFLGVTMPERRASKTNPIPKAIKGTTLSDSSIAKYLKMKNDAIAIKIIVPLCKTLYSIIRRMPLNASAFMPNHVENGTKKAVTLKGVSQQFIPEFKGEII